MRSTTIPRKHLHRRFLELPELLTRDLIFSWEGLLKHAPSGVLSGKYPSELDLVAWEAMQSALEVQSTFLDILRLTTAGYLPHTALELRRAEATISASQLEAHPQAAPVE